MPRNERLKRAVEEIKFQTNFKQAQIAEKLGVKSTYLSDMINGRVPETVNMVEKIYELFHIRINNLTSQNENQETIAINSNDIKAYKCEGTPVYNIDGTCGMNERDFNLANEQIIGYVDLPEIKKSSVIIRANGDSMEPVINDGDRVVIREIHNFDDIFYGQKYVVLTEEYRMIKYIRRYEPDEDNYIILRSENSKYDDIKLGKGKIRKLFIIENIISIKNQI